MCSSVLQTEQGRLANPIQTRSKHPNSHMSVVRSMVGPANTDAITYMRGPRGYKFEGGGRSRTQNRNHLLVRTCQAVIQLAPLDAKKIKDKLLNSLSGS